jgi:hypothetical protein
VSKSSCETIPASVTGTQSALDVAHLGEKTREFYPPYNLPLLLHHNERMGIGGLQTDHDFLEPIEWWAVKNATMAAHAHQ